MFSYSSDIVHSDFIRFLPGYVVHVEIHTVNAADTNALTSIPPACKQEMLELLAKPVKCRLELLESSHHRQQQKSLGFSEPQLLTGKTVKIAFSFKPSNIRNHSLLVKRDVGYRELRLFPEKLVVFSFLSEVASNAVGVASSYFRSTDTDDDTSSILLASNCESTVTSKSVAQRSAVIVTDGSGSNNNNSRISSKSQRVVNRVKDVVSTVSHVVDNQTAAVCTSDSTFDALPCMTVNMSKHLSNETESNITDKRKPDVNVRRKSTSADPKQHKSLSLSRFKFQPLNRIRHRLLKNAISPHVATVHGSARRRSNMSYRNSPARHTSVDSSPVVSSAAAVGKCDENSNRCCEVNQIRVETLLTREQHGAASYDKLHCSPLLTPAAVKPKLSPTTTEGGHPVCSNSRNLFSTFGFVSDCPSPVELRPVETSDHLNIEKTLEAKNCGADHMTRLKLMPEKHDVMSVADAGSSTGCGVDINTVETIVIDDEDDVDGNSCSDVDKSRQHKEKLKLASQRRLVRKSSGSLSVTLLPLADMSAGPSSPGRLVRKVQTTPQFKVGKLLHISPSKQTNGKTTSQTHFRQSAHISCGEQSNGDHLTLQSPGSEKLSSVDLSYEPVLQCKELKPISEQSTDADRQSYHKPTRTDLRTNATLNDDKDSASMKTCAKSVSDESVQLSSFDHVMRRPLSRKLALKLHKKTRPDPSASCDGSQNSSSPQTEISCSFSAESKESKSTIKHGIVSSVSIDGLNVFDKMKDDSSCGGSVKRELADDCSGGSNPKRARKSSDTDDSDDSPGMMIKETIILASRCSSVDSELEEKSRLRTVLGITGGDESSGRPMKQNSALNIVCCDNRKVRQSLQCYDETRKARQSLLCYDETQSIDVDELFDAQQVSQVVDEPLVTIEVDEDEDWCRMQQQISAIKNAADLTNEHLSYFVLSHERYLRDIFQGKKSCKRHVLYRNGGKDRRCLSWMLPVGLFTYEQHELVLGVLMEIFCKTHQKYFDYLLRVLLPEILIKIVMDVYGLEHDAAENKMRERQNRL